MFRGKGKPVIRPVEVNDSARRILHLEIYAVLQIWNVVARSNRVQPIEVLKIEDVYYLAINKDGDVETLLETSDEALDYKGRNPELCDRIEPVIRANVFVKGQIGHKDDVEYILKEIKKSSKFPIQI